MTADLVRARLVALGTVASTVTSGAAWVCLVGGLSDTVDAPQVAVLDTGGLAPIDAHNGPHAQRPGIQVLIRGAPNAYAATATKAAAVWTALHRTRWGDVLDLAAVTSPIWLGYEADTNRPMWSVNLIAHTR